MFNATNELFLSEYFLIQTVLGSYLEDREGLFRILSKIFLIPASCTTKLYRLTENDLTKGITTEQDYLQYQRIQKYSQMIGSEIKVDAAWEEVTGIKGNAIKIAHEHKLILGAEASRNALYTGLSAAANEGAVFALRMMGILQCEGIFLNRNELSGIKTLSKSADWNDCISILALLHYRSENRSFNMARLRQSVAGTPFEALYRIAAEKYGEADEEVVEEVKLLDRSFNSGVLKRETYDPKYARILYSSALGIRDKEKAVFTPHKEQLCAVSDLPLKLSHENAAAVDESQLKKAPLVREAELGAIARALRNGDLRCMDSYRPLCLCCESKFVLNMYAKAIRVKSADAHYEIIDVAQLSEYDLEPSANNIFVRSIDEDRDNRFLLFCYGDITPRKQEAVKGILQSARRASFHLHSPNVTLNMSAVLPICFCDEENSQWLRAYCDTLVLDQVSSAELPVVIKDILADKKKLYGVGEIRIEGEIGKVFKGYDADTAERIVDTAIRARREKGAIITLTRAIMQEYAVDSGRQTIGFGGDSNEK